MAASAWRTPAQRAYAPSPVAGWDARDVVRHLTEWFPAFLAAGAGIDLPRGPSVDENPVAAWQVHCDVPRVLPIAKYVEEDMLPPCSVDQLAVTSLDGAMIARNGTAARYSSPPMT
jgi:Mycothiol maleylpyruvate isomerase N-terminal domain